MVGLSQLEGLLTGADFPGDSVHLVIEDITEALRKDEGKDVVLIFRSIFSPSDGGRGIPDPGLERFFSGGCHGDRENGV